MTEEIKNNEHNDVKKDQDIENSNDEMLDDEVNPEDEKKYSDADVNKLFDKKFAEYKSKWEAEKDEAERLAAMDATEKAEYENQKLKRELEDLKKERSRAEMKNTARNILSNQGINVSDGLIQHLIADDAETTKDNINAFTELFNAAVQSEVNNKLRGRTPKSSNGGPSLTKKDILDIEDPTERRRKIAENIELFKY